ncbi:conserved hypothetical protein [Ricinus communis]|uniref:Uncharacterized protein n=1 Tax=Ricinus communis TaxID=3988 RepID=B9T363_RICCO|nr:conserved hypothetical protein [Ricinus communis]
MVKDLSRLDQTQKSIQLVFLTLWRIWKSRNALIFDDQGWTANAVALKALTDVEEFEAALKVIPKVNYGFRDQPPSPSPVDNSLSIKVNFDAAVYNRGLFGSLRLSASKWIILVQNV